MPQNNERDSASAARASAAELEVESEKGGSELGAESAGTGGEAGADNEAEDKAAAAPSAMIKEVSYNREVGCYFRSHSQ